MIDCIEPPPIYKPPSAVIKFAKRQRVKLLAQEKNIPIETNIKNIKKYKKYKIYPCYTLNDSCTILYKNPFNIRFATKEEEKDIYFIFR